MRPHLNLPMTLTLLRMALIPVFVLVFLSTWRWANVACTVLFVGAAITDWLDGYLARRLNQTSRFGAFLDPVADKLMVATALVMVLQAGSSPVLAVAATVIIGREIAISALREWMAEIGRRHHVKVSGIGKVKTILQMVALSFLVYREPLMGLPVEEIGLWLLCVAAVLTLWSMFVYLRAAWPSLKA